MTVRGFAFIWSKEEGLTRFLVLLVLVLFVLFPLSARGRIGTFATVAVDVALCVTAISGAWTLGWGRVSAALVSATAVAAFALRQLEPYGGRPMHAVSALLYAVVLAAVAGLLLTRVLGEGPVTRRRIEGAVAVYLLVAVVAASLHDGILSLDPGAVRSADGSPVTAADLMYLSFVTLTTVGYGDIVPVSVWSRAVANLEGLVGMLYPAILIARLVSLQIGSQNGRR